MYVYTSIVLNSVFCSRGDWINVQVSFCRAADILSEAYRGGYLYYYYYYYVSSLSTVLNHTLACTVQNRGDLSCNHGVMEG